MTKYFLCSLISFGLFCESGNVRINVSTGLEGDRRYFSFVSEKGRPIELISNMIIIDAESRIVMWRGGTCSVDKEGRVFYGNKQSCEDLPCPSTDSGCQNACQKPRDLERKHTYLLSAKTPGFVAFIPDFSFQEGNEGR